ncbi:Follistatin-related protein 5 [Acropora cervicornis]|uniref:Follistatin-related protein 5 n=1 Tax=Acropora cervicornis TaxID=6130 RepID=A0AAD9QJI2_ACRCE|nr:Follistatin-related protein 5 [Acropora cervicornis]
MSSFLTLLIGFTCFANVYCNVLREALPVDGTTTVFYVFGSEAIYIVEPENKTVLSTIEAGDLCTPGRGSYCFFGTEILVRNELIFFGDYGGSRVHVIDVRKRKVVETIATEPRPYDLYYLPWLEEVWVHAWFQSTFDVIDVSGNLEKTHKAIKAHITPGWTHGFMVANKEIEDGKVGYVTHFRNPGLHQLDLTTKSYKDFHNISDQGCHGTFYIAYSSLNKHTFVECFRADFILEMDLTKEQVIRKWNFSGKPYASPDGRFIVALYISINRTTNQLLDSKIHVLRISENEPTSILKTFDIPSGVSRLVFDKKAGQQSGYVVYISLHFSDKIAILDLDELESGRDALRYIEGVGFVQTTPYSPATARPLFVSGRWLVSPASANDSVAIIDTSTQKLHGMVPGVVKGRGLLAVSLPPPSSPPSPTAGAEGKLRFNGILTLVMLLAPIILHGR